MNKRLVAGVCAALMFSSALPMPEIAKYLPLPSTSVIVADAASSSYSATYGGNSYGQLTSSATVAKDNDTGDITFTTTISYYDLVHRYDFSASDSTLRITDEMVLPILEEAYAKVKEKNKNCPAVDYSSAEIVFAGDFALSGFPNLSHVIFADSYIDTLSGNFQGHTNLQTVDFGNNITKVGANTFNGCTSFVGGTSNNTLQMKNVKSIDQNAFNGCKLVEYINFSSSTVDIGKAAFQNCSALKSLSFPASLKTIEDNAFNGCAQLTTATFANNTALDRIGSTAFTKCSLLKTVNFGTGTTVSTLGKQVFSECSALTTVKADGVSNTLPQGIQVAAFDIGLFSKCTSLKSFIWPDYLKIIPDSTFSGCSSLSTFKFGDDTGSKSKCIRIGASAFNGCTHLNSIVLPESAVMIGQSAFSGCSILQKVVVSNDLICLDGTHSYASLTFTDKNLESQRQKVEATKDLVWYFIDYYSHKIFYTTESHTYNEDTATVDPYNANLGGTFASCPVLSIYPRSEMAKANSNFADYANRVMLPDSLINIPATCFQSCTGLVGVQFGKNTVSLGNGAFQSCSSLPEVTLPEGVVVLNANVFDGCKKLADVVIASKTNTIYADAFKDCEVLATLTPNGSDVYPFTVQFPSTCGGVQKEAFLNCKTFKYLSFLTDDQNKTNFAVCGQSAFKGCTNLCGSNIDGTTVDTITLPTGVVVIQTSAFENCTNIKNMVLLGDVTTIDASAFSGCQSMESIIMKSTVKQIGAKCFYNCKSLKTLPRTDAGKSALTQITVINANTFYGCTSLESADIPANVTTIDTSAFQGCTALTTVNIAANSQLNNIGTNAFNGCTALEKFTDTANTKGISYFPTSVVNINANAFEKTALKHIVIKAPANGATNVIGASAFANNAALEIADLSGSNLAIINNNLFNKCTALKTVYLPSATVTSIGQNAFSDCWYLHTLGVKSGTAGAYVFPASVTTIGANAFSNNYCMQSVTFPAKVTDIQISMFNFNNLKEEDIAAKGYTPLETIKVNSGNLYYSSKDGVLFNKDKTVLYVYPFRKADKTYTVPASVRTIWDSAFMTVRFLENVILNDDITEIQQKAFYNTFVLEGIDFGGNTTVAIGQDAFTATASHKGDDGKLYKIKLYGTVPSTVYDYSHVSRNISKVEFIAHASVLNLLDKDGNDAGDLIRIPNNPDSYQLGAFQTDGSGNITTEKLNWSTNNGAVATVDDNGLVRFINPGTATITVSNISGKLSDSVQFSIFEMPVVTLAQTEFDYTGSAIKPEVTVTCEGLVLSKDVDYTVSYTNNTSAGTATVKVTGKGNYPFTKSLTFKIKAKPIAGATIKPQYTSYTYSGSAIKPVVTVTSAEGKVLTEGTDYSISFSNNTKVGVATITVTGKKAYEGTATGSFVVKPAKNTATLSNYNGGIKVSWNKGTAGTVGYQVMYAKDKDFTKDSHSTTVAASSGKLYVNLTSVPKAGETWYVKVRSFYTKDGKLDSTRYGNYSAVKSITVSNPIKTVSIPYSSYTYTGSAIKPTVTVKDSSGAKVAATNYTVTYSNNTKVGTATIKVVAKGKYSGTLTKTFVIKPAKNKITYIASSTAKSVTLKWNKATAGATGYQIQYAKDSAFTKDVHSTSITNLSTLTKTITSNIKSGETWYFRVRSYYIPSGSTTRYGNYSDTKSIKVK
ncbi:MAG: leucine-rich repeat domain-containing protein [Ruminococcus sp.]|nr:leucine-rich repeat domain-containing protein [Ruminococcus sp.]